VNNPSINTDFNTPEQRQALLDRWLAEDPEAILPSAFLDRLTRLMVDRLPLKERAVWRLRLFGWRTAAIARRLDYPERFVRRVLERIRGFAESDRLSL
jgi:hypothetical protein